MCPTPSSAGPLELKLPATPSSVTIARHGVAEFCAGQVLDHGAVALAVTEAVANAVVHAYRDGDPGLVYVAASLDDGTLAVVISDDGKGMRPRTDSPGIGIGLALIANLTDSMQIEHDGGGTRLIMRFARAA
jgi:serine/threonine-protein kinase RsbW